jgi:hypothetical protein
MFAIDFGVKRDRFSPPAGLNSPTPHSVPFHLIRSHRPTNTPPHTPRPHPGRNPLNPTQFIPAYPSFMPDLRTLSLDQRRELCVEAERRARSGEAPGAIRAALGLSKGSYSSWAKLFGFRQCDLFPDKERVGAPPLHPPGPGGYVGSGRVFRGLPPRGAPAARQEIAGLNTAKEVLAAVDAAREAGDRRHADRLLMAWRARGRRAADYAALEAAAAAEFDASDLTDAELWREICEMQGWPAPDEAGGVALEDLDEAAWAALCAGRRAVPG